MKLNRQHTEILEILENSPKYGMNSFQWRTRFIQLPVRIKELKGMGYTIISRQNKNRSVNYILLSSSQALKPTTEPQKEVQPWEKPLIRIEKNGRVFWEEPKGEEQLSL